MDSRKQELIDHITTFTHEHPHGVVIIRGATATGKSSLAIEIGQHLPIEVLSADSRQVYKHMDIATDKLLPDQQQGIPHHLIDIVTPDQVFTAGQWKQRVQELIPAIHAHGHLPVIVGGTGLYIDTIYKNFSMPEVPPQPKRREQMMEREEHSPGFLYTQLEHVDPQEAMKHHPHSVRYLLRALEIYHVTGQPKSLLAQERPVQWPLLMIGLRRSKEDTNRKINQRIKQMFERGVIEEVEQLLGAGYDPSSPAMESIGYQEIVRYLAGEYSLEKAKEFFKRNSHRYAKRQRSWFRRYIAEGKMRPKENVTYLVYDLSQRENT